MAHKDLQPYCISFGPKEIKNKDAMDALQELMDANFKAMAEYEEKIMLELGISEACAMDVAYLRGRSRWTQALEDKLIDLHKAGTPPNIFDFGN